MPVYGILKIEGVQTLILAGNSESEGGEAETYCYKSIVMNGQWAKCAPLPVDSFLDMKTSIVWLNRLVALADSGGFVALAESEFLYVYNPDEDVWSVTPALFTLFPGSFFLSVENHLCLEGGRYNEAHPEVEDGSVVYCLEHIESTEWIETPIDSTEWIEMRNEYAFKTDQNLFMGTLPAKIVSTMVTANTAWEAANSAQIKNK